MCPPRNPLRFPARRGRVLFQVTYHALAGDASEFSFLDSTVGLSTWCFDESNGLGCDFFYRSRPELASCCPKQVLPQLEAAWTHIKFLGI